jgi:hypothetical protein
MSAADQLLAFRREVKGFTAESFPAISGAGENGAIVHYRVTEATNRPIAADECYLIDSGAQFPDGTTDITRTLWSGPGAAPAGLRARYTAVLRGHIALGTLRFPEGWRGRTWMRSRAGRSGMRVSITITAPAMAWAAFCPSTKGPAASAERRGWCPSARA